MSVRFDAGTDYFRRTSDLLDYNHPYTMMGWFNTASVQDFGTPLIIWTGGFQNQDALQRAGTSNAYTLEVWTGGSGSGGSGSATIPIDTWEHLTIVRESATSLKAYINGGLAITNTNDTTGRTSATQMNIGSTTVTYDGRAFAIKAWQEALTAEQIAQESRTIRPIHLPDLYAWWPVLPGSPERARDYSPNGRDWTEGGTLADEDHMSIPWSAPILFMAPAIVPLTSQMFTPWKARLLDGTADMDTIDLRVALLMSNTSAFGDIDAATLSAITTLDEYDGARYVRKRLPGQSVLRHDADGVGYLSVPEITWPRLGTGTRQATALLLYEHVDGTAANDRPIGVIVPTAFPVDGDDLNLTIDWLNERALELA